MAYTTLIEAESLLQHRDEADWRVFDCRCSPSDPTVGRKQYVEGHIPGARHADLDQVLASLPNPMTGRHPLPDRAELATWLGREGVSTTTQMVAYDDSGGAFAARLWWLARWLGHADVAVLDGGLAAWREAGGTLERGEAQAPAPADFQIREPLTTMLTADDVLAIVQESAEGTLIDARAAPRYRGQSEPIDSVAGHIPGARSRPFADNLDARGRFLDPAALRERFAAVADDPRAAVHYCGSGVTACHNVLAMEHAGLAGSRLYAGSWSEWIRDPSRPVSRDDEGG
ncbi:MAG: sulfurtransferase [Gammaproteobacteria bacterium]